MGISKRAAAPRTSAPRDNARALAMSVEAIRLNWNRSSQRIVDDAQDRVALERPQGAQLRGQYLAPA